MRAEHEETQHLQIIFFTNLPDGEEIAQGFAHFLIVDVLTMDEDSGRWEMERAMLREKTAYAIVVEPDKVKAYMDEVEYEMLNGGPVWVQ